MNFIMINIMTINYMCTWFHLPDSSKQIAVKDKSLKQRYRVTVSVYTIRNITAQWLSVGKNMKSFTLEMMTENFSKRKQTTTQTKHLYIYNVWARKGLLFFALVCCPLAKNSKVEVSIQEIRNISPFFLIVIIAELEMILVASCYTAFI